MVLAGGKTKAVYVKEMQNCILDGGAAMYKNKMTIYNKTIQICPLCTSYERLSVEHYLLTCNSFDH